MDHNVRSFNSTEEMLNSMAADEAEADAAILPQQREIVWGSCFYKFVPPVNEKDQGIHIFGRVDTLEEIVKGEQDAGADLAEVDYYRRMYTDSYARNYRRGWHYSVVVPDGEYGSSHLVSMWPISTEDFVQAKALGWTPSPETAARIAQELAEASYQNEE